MEEINQKLILNVDGKDMQCFYGSPNQPDVEIQMSRSTMEDIVNGRMTFQRAFMAGSMKMKGDFKILRTLDLLFPFEQKGA